MDEYDGRQFVGIDLHRQRSVIVRQSESGEQLSAVRIVNDPVALELQLEQAGADPEVVLEATYGWYWAVDVLHACGARVHLAHPLGVKGIPVPAGEKRRARRRRSGRSAADGPTARGLDRPTADPRSCGSWCATEPSWSRPDPVSRRQIHAVLAKAGVLIAVSDLFGVTGRQRLAKVPLGSAYAERIRSLLELIDILDGHEARGSPR